ncbi:MAG: hypothetical protein IT380_14055 [Myxococcales bacterium]|nr:hypothetical protein [Myxococcales bacterium]
MVDYKKFLGKQEALVLPWLGGPTVEAEGRRLRLTKRPKAPGWYRFEVKGRDATPGEAADTPDVSKLPKVRGWLWGERLVHEGARAEPMALLPTEEPPLFSPLSARRWYSGELFFDALEFESEAEGQVREALALGRGLAEVKGVAAGLRAAFGYALLTAASKKSGVPFVASEVKPRVAEVAQGGAATAEAALEALEEERVVARREWLELERRRLEALVREEVEAEREARRTELERREAELAQVLRQRRGRGGPVELAEAALAQAGAVLETARRLNANQLEVVFRFMGERFISIVDAHTLQVIDSGICLGHPPRDDLITLDSLPSVIKEAIDGGFLVILRWP